ncbi:hypothetical protein [Halorarius halobius]|uniref:hypothetical protein n=1 Tax=Halorarius halobius TaxID=2962671 RepID=UPI0020CE178C|nr:hypothetical protein [Halorarius halobius]
MRALLDSGPTRAGVFFLAALLTATLFGLALGDPRQGVTTGVTVGLVMAAFGWLFVRPTDDKA